MTSRLAKLLEKRLDHWALRLEVRLRAGGPVGLLDLFYHFILQHGLYFKVLQRINANLSEFYDQVLKPKTLKGETEAISI